MGVQNSTSGWRWKIAGWSLRKWKLFLLGKVCEQDVPGSPVTGLHLPIHREWAKIPHAFQPNKTKHQNMKQKKYCNKFNEDLKPKVQTQTGRPFSCLVLPRLNTFRKAEPILGKAKAPRVRGLRWSWGPGATLPLPLLSPYVSPHVTLIWNGLSMGYHLS